MSQQEAGLLPSLVNLSVDVKDGHSSYIDVIPSSESVTDSATESATEPEAIVSKMDHEGWRMSRERVGYLVPYVVQGRMDLSYLPYCVGSVIALVLIFSFTTRCLGDHFEACW